MKNKIKRLGVINEGELSVEFFKDEKSTLKFIKDNDATMVAYFEITKRLDDSIKSQFKKEGEVLSSICYPASRFQKELSHFELFK